MTFEQFKSDFLKWSEEKIESKKSDGFAVCPYAKHARVNNKIQFIDAREEIFDALMSFDKDTYEIGIAWVDGVDLLLVEDIIENLNVKEPELMYFISTTDSGHFVKNFTNCVFIQLSGDILEKREQLHKTNYYKSWPEAYYKIITGGNI